MQNKENHTQKTLSVFAVGLAAGMLAHQYFSKHKGEIKSKFSQIKDDSKDKIDEVKGKISDKISNYKDEIDEATDEME